MILSHTGSTGAAWYVPLQLTFGQTCRPSNAYTASGQARDEVEILLLVLLSVTRAVNGPWRYPQWQGGEGGYRGESKVFFFSCWVS